MEITRKSSRLMDLMPSSPFTKPWKGKIIKKGKFFFWSVTYGRIKIKTPYCTPSSSSLCYSRSSVLFVSRHQRN